MAAIETTDEIIDKLRLNVAQLGISTIRKLQILFAKRDKDKRGIVANEEFVGSLNKCNIFISKIDSSNIIRYFKVNELEINYDKFMDELSPSLTTEREKVVKQLFDLIKEETQNEKENIILHRDLITLCNFKNHPSVQSGQFSINYARQIIKTAFDGIENEKDEIIYEDFVYFFRGIASGYPYNTKALIRFIQSCWNTVFEKVNNGNFSVEESKKYVEQIEAMLAEKTRQKVKGSESETNTLLRQFKHFDTESFGYLNYSQFVRTLESFGVMAPEKELSIMFHKWSKTDKNTQQKRLFYRPFIQEIFKKY